MTFVKPAFFNSCVRSTSASHFRTESARYLYALNLPVTRPPMSGRR